MINTSTALNLFGEEKRQKSNFGKLLFEYSVAMKALKLETNSWLHDNVQKQPSFTRTGSVLSDFEPPRSKNVHTLTQVRVNVFN